MHRHDLILTPNMTWHDHGNETDQPMIWLDCLDIPLVQMPDGTFVEQREDRGACPPTRPAGDSHLLWGQNLRPVRASTNPHRTNPLLIYPFEQWREALETMRRSEAPHPHEAYLMEFVNPLDGGPVMATMSAFARLVPAGFLTKSARATDGMVHVVTEGSGSIVVNSAHIPLTPGSIVVAPSWSERTISASEDLVLFSHSDGYTAKIIALAREFVVDADCHPVWLAKN